LFAKPTKEGLPLLAAIYVDDLKVAGPAASLKQFWKDIADPETGAFQSTPPEELKEFLGAQYERFKEVRENVECDIIHVNLAEYTRKMVEAYETMLLNGKKVGPRKVASTKCIRVNPDAVDEKGVKLYPAHPPRHEHQKIIGMLLWVMRVCRPDIAEIVSGLGSRVSRWDSDCDEQLRCLMGYLKATAEQRLEFCWPVCEQGRSCASKTIPTSRTTDLAGGHTVTPVAGSASPTPWFIPELHSDADWRGSEKSQSSFVAWVRPRNSPVGGCPIHYQSKKQSVTACSAADSEIVATHFAFTEGSWPLIVLLGILGFDETGWELLVDNNTAEGNMNKKESEVIAHKAKAFDCKNGYLHDMFMLGRFKAGHIHTDLNRSDAGTKSAKGVGQQEHWRARLGLNLSKKHHRDARRAAWLLCNSNTPPPKENLETPPDEEVADGVLAAAVGGVQAAAKAAYAWATGLN